jgi:predicted membrane chloride channel (bestrophin family)
MVIYTHKAAQRMPLAYVQFVQILVDTFVFISPLALYTELGDSSVIAVGLLAFFYCGLNNLGKIFLDPLNNEEFCDNAIFLDLGVIVSELVRHIFDNIILWN